MIRRIGVICQDRNSHGFLRGLGDRLRCGAAFVDGPANIGRSRALTRRHAALAWKFFQKQTVDIIVRFTDAEQGLSEVVARIVREAPPAVFRQWLLCDDALRAFYAECRRAAAAEDCPTPNELEPNP